MKTSNKLSSLWIILWAAAGLMACAGLKNDSGLNSMISDQTASPTDGLIVEPEATATPAKALPDGLMVITAENAQKITQLAAIAAPFPDYCQISPDGRIGVLGDLNGLDIMEMAGGDAVMHINARLPDCEFGMERYFALNQNGGFIAIAAQDSIQVWQVGGGQIFDLPYSLKYRTDPNTCGADIPQLAVSPDGTLLAVYGIIYSRTSAEEYFKVYDVLQNKALYEWNGKDENLHGELYPYQGLGFSADGKLIQTFDPTRFRVSSEKEYQAFRYWSVGDWQEVSGDSALVKDSFAPAQRMYAVFTDDAVVIKDRFNGKILTRLSGTGCTSSTPCELRFSPQGEFAAILDTNEERLDFHHDTLFTGFTIWDMRKGRQSGQVEFLARNLDGVSVTDEGGIVNIADNANVETFANAWWTSSFNFNGLNADQDGGITFTPQQINLEPDAGYFRSACRVDLQTLAVACQPDALAQEGGIITYQADSEKLIVRSGSGVEAQASLPSKLPQGWTARLMGFAEEKSTFFYCLDKNRRSQVCGIYSAMDDRVIAEPEDIYDLRLSPDGQTAAYINRDQKALFIVNLPKSKVAKVSAYQARACFVNPVYSSDGSELIYIVENLKDSSVLSLEWVDSRSAKVLCRLALESGAAEQPTVLALNEENTLLAVGDAGGRATLLDTESGKIITSWQAASSRLIGLTFAQNGKILVSLDESGEFAIWGIQ